MRAAVYRKYGPPEVVTVEEMEKPAPRENEILVKVRAASVTSGDARLRAFNIPSALFWLPGRFYSGLFAPKHNILGADLSGTVEAIGSAVQNFQPGDDVIAFTGVNLGAHAEYVCLSEDSPVAPKPENVTFEQATAAPFGGTAALYFLRDLGKVKAGQNVLINGASGAVGTAAVQIARHLGARVTGICSGANRELVESLGAERVIDYTKEDFTKSGEQYDAILDTIGKINFRQSKPVMKNGGVYLAPVMTGTEVFQIIWTSMFGNKRVLGGIAPERKEDLLYLKELLETGALRPVIDRTYPLDEIADAHRQVDSGHKKGSVVIAMG
ncbi:NAD(P)-dependent alcohol dehydrogenase [bacterium]|nr:NAD(P)-dependent alcohol dehydrogenase [bacterium]